MSGEKGRGICPALTMHFGVYPLSLPVEQFDEIGAIIFLFIVKKQNSFAGLLKGVSLLLWKLVL